MHGAVVTCQLIVTVKYSLFILYIYPQETSADIDIKDLISAEEISFQFKICTAK